MQSRFNKIKILFLLNVIFLFSMSAAYGQTTAFTYQGRLTDSSVAQPTNGAYDFLFKIFNAATGGSQQGVQIAVSNVAVTNGIFTVTLDFGTALISPTSDLFLEIGARPAGPQGAFTTLAPRQQITSAPFAVQALNAASSVDAQNLGGVAANQFVTILDPRLTDDRNPLAGSANYIQNTNNQQTANFNISGDGTVGATLTASFVRANIQYNIGASRVLSAGGTNNLFVGVNAGANNSTGNNNVFVGTLAGLSNTSFSENAFFGSSAGQNSNAGFNSFFGSGAGMANTTGNLNAFFGFQTGKSNLAGTLNAFFGERAGFSNSSGSKNAIFGAETGFNNLADNNSFFGFQAGFNNTTAIDNAFFGSEAGRASNASFNSFFGSNAGRQTSSGGQNSFFGYQAGKSNTTGGLNAFFGESAGFTNTTGSLNAFFGTQSGNKTNGSNNSFFGSAAGSLTTSALNNTFIGFNTGATATTEDNNTLLGSGADITAGVNDSTAIGINAKATVDHTIVLGTSAETVIIPGLGAAGSTQLCRNASNQISSCSSSLRYKTNIAPFDFGLSLARRLRPVSFNWREGNQPDLGLVAEDVAAVEPLLVTYNENGAVEGVKYDRISVVLLNAVKQQQMQIERQNEQIKEQQRTIEAMKTLVCASNKKAEVCRDKK